MAAQNYEIHQEEYNSAVSSMSEQVEAIRTTAKQIMAAVTGVQGAGWAGEAQKAHLNLHQDQIIPSLNNLNNKLDSLATVLGAGSKNFAETEQSHAHTINNAGSVLNL